MKVKTVVLAGHLSDFGWAWWQSLLTSPDFQIVAVYLAPVEDWWQFYLRLSRNAPAFSRLSLARKHQRRTSYLRQQLSNYPGQPPVSIGLPSPEELIRTKASLVYTAAFPRIFSPAYCTALNQRFVFLNTHPSYLPYCRGANPMYWTIAGWHEKAGISSHQITADLDAGPLLVRDELPVDPKSDYFDELKVASYEQLPIHHQRVATAIVDQRPFFQPTEPSTFFRQDQPQDRLVDWSEDWLKNDAKIRAGNAWASFPGVSQMIQKISFNPSRDTGVQEWEYTKWTPTTFAVTTKQGRIEGSHFLIYPKLSRRVLNRLERKLVRFILPTQRPEFIRYG